MPEESVNSSTETLLIFTTPSLARRMACWFYEGMLLFGVIFLAGYLFGTLSQTKHALDNRHGLQAFLFLVFAIYFTWLWSKGEDLAYQSARCFWQTTDSVSGLAQILAELVVVFTAHCCGLPLQIACASRWAAGPCLGFCLGTLKQIPIAWTILA
jgi:hypothetical protein